MNAQMTATQSDRLQAAKAEAVATYLKPNTSIVGIGIGKKLINGEWTDCLRIYVVQRQPEGLIRPVEAIPRGTVIAGVPVDVIQLGPFGRNPLSPVKDTGTDTQPGSPIRVKTELTNINEGARGTLGAVVTDGADTYILSCNHILAVNGRVPSNRDAAAVVSAEFVGDEKAIASRCEFVPLRRNASNLVDCAIAKLNDAKSVRTDFPAGTVRLTSAEVAAPRADMIVSKVGAGTGLTRGRIVDCDVDLFVPYSFLDSVRFDHQMMIQSEPEGGSFATNGDSGALVVDDDSGQAVGMIFASSGGFAVATPLETVLAEIGRKVDRAISLVIAGNPPAPAVRPAMYKK
jgi:hypothetical protein